MLEPVTQPDWPLWEALLAWGPPHGSCPHLQLGSLRWQDTGLVLQHEVLTLSLNLGSVRENQGPA